uniref:Uncharacterized protein n=1 Tax=Cucumis sativus TaxID=3659 RepID=A0A0A0K9F5_CUCSA
MAEAEENQMLLPIYCRSTDHKDQLPIMDNAVVVEVKDNLKKLLMKSVAVEKLGSSGKTIKPSIYKIPNFIKDVHKEAYMPHMVSFGPYHHGEKNLAPMEQEKLKVFRHLVDVKGVDYESIVSDVSNILEDLYGAYDDLDEDWWKDNAGSAKFMKMMILHIFYSKDQNTTLTSLISNLLFVEKDELAIVEKKHILHMYRASLLYPSTLSYPNMDEIKKNNKDDKFGLKCQLIPQATLLREAGIRFRKSENKSLENVSFEKGVLTLPSLIVDDNTKTNLLNVMAFEKLHDVGSQVTSFVVLMNNLIDIDKDVELLSNDNIIANALGNNEEAANLFSVLGKGVSLDLGSNNLTEVHQLVNIHCDDSWNRWWANLKHTYFQNPWAIISFFGAIFGFAILIVQAVYQIVDFHTK